MSTVSTVLGNDVYQRIVARMQQSFPDAASVVHEQHADALVLSLWQTCDAATCQAILGVPKPDDATIAAAVAAEGPVKPAQDGLTYYIGQATHARVSNPTHSFTGKLPLVRVQLAAKTADAKTITTAIGDVIPQDHLLASVSQVAFKYGDVLDHGPSRVDLITPARMGGSRFAAIALYLGYQDADEPNFYILEAGLATGESRVAFFSGDMGVIAATKKGYAPTPFTNEDAFYSGKLVMTGDDPDTLTVHALSPSLQPEVQVDVKYVKGPPTAIWPALITAEAAARIGSIAVRRGQLVFEDVLAPIGELLPWNVHLQNQLIART